MKLTILICLIVASIYIVQAEAGINSTSNNNKINLNDQRKLRQENDKKEISNFLTGRNLIKTIIKLLFGNNEESAATSRQVLSVLVKFLDLLRNSFTQKARNSNSIFKNSFDATGLAIVTLLESGIEGYTETRPACLQKIACELGNRSMQNTHELGSIITQAGSYAFLSFLEHKKKAQSSKMYEAFKKGKNGEECTKLYSFCVDDVKDGKA